MPERNFPEKLRGDSRECEIKERICGQAIRDRRRNNTGFARVAGFVKRFLFGKCLVFI